ncbi:serine carboxypeptidase 1-like [Miscanthus floridulus]|uniref:serine carboxypeptidase 1-like n=1 Tax=Miscanthus floridulus TaxID=154761 RepID=UPI003457D8BD
MAAALHAADARSTLEAQLWRFMRSRRSSGGHRSGTSTSRSTTIVADDMAVVASRLKGRIMTTLHSGDGSGDDDLRRFREADKIAALPGQPGGVDFDQYGGRVTVDADRGRALFYYFVEAPRHEAASKPLLLWLNGGPGCSSLGYGAMEEIGPFRVNNDSKTLCTNKHAWNNVANVIFLESPAGVGFSYSNTSSDYESSGDEKTANDAYLFLINWLERFPEYKGRPFYISGESYAGHYAPQLAVTILLLNAHNNSKTIINLQGILVGNPLLDNYWNSKGLIDYFWSHGVMSDEVFENVSRNCGYSNNPDTDDSASSSCTDAWHVFDKGEIDPYNIYAPVCVDTPQGAYYPSSYLPGYDPCSDRYTSGYLNHPEVQSSFHARPTNWSLCVNLTWKDAPDSMVPTLIWLISKGLPVWIFSGDFDAICPLPATRYSIGDLGLHITTPWRPWTAQNEVGGYVQQYTGGFTFLSVRGAGHAVASFQPERALVLVNSFLKGELPPNAEE